MDVFLPTAAMSNTTYGLDIWGSNFTEMLNNTLDVLSDNTTDSPGALTFREALKKDPAYMAAKHINNYKIYPLMVIALIGNALSITVLLKRGLLSSTCNFFLVNLAVWDTLLIWLRGVSFILTTIKGGTLSSAGCKTIVYLQNVAVQNAVWVVVIMTIDRFVAIRFPLKMVRLCTLKRAKITLCGLLVFTLIFNVEYFIIVESYIRLDLPSCRYVAQYENFANKIWSWIDMAVYAIVPEIAIFTLNVIIITTLRRARKSQADLVKVRGKVKKDHLTPMLLTVSIVFFLLTTPKTCLIIIKGYWNFKKTVDSFVLYHLLNTIFRLLADLNHCINFFLYFVSGPSFRKDLAKLFPCRKIKACREKSYKTTTKTSTAYKSTNTFSTHL